MSTMRITTAAALAVVFAVATASAQQAATQRVAGTLDKVEGNTLYIKAASGPVILKLADNALIVARIKASAADIKAGDYVASGGVPQPDGTQKAVELRIFPESMRGIHAYQTMLDSSLPWIRTAVSGLRQGSPNQSSR